MSQALNFEYLRQPLHDDLIAVALAIGEEPELPETAEQWADILQSLRRVRDVCDGAGLKKLHHIASEIVDYAEELAAGQYNDPHEAAERLISAIFVLAEQPHLFEHPSVGADWTKEIDLALRRSPDAHAAMTHTDAYALAGKVYSPVLQRALVALLKGDQTISALGAIAASFGRLAHAADNGAGLSQHLAALAEGMKRGCLADERKATRSLAKGVSLLRRRLAGNADGEAEWRLRSQCAAQLSVVHDTAGWLGVLREKEATEQSSPVVNIWRPKQALSPIAANLTGLAEAMREDLAYVVEVLDVNSRAAMGGGQDTVALAQRVAFCADILAAAGIEKWAQELHTQSALVLRASSRSACMNIAERLEDLVARLEPEVLESWMSPESDRRRNEGARAIVGEMSRTAVIEAGLTGVDRLAARLELVLPDSIEGHEVTRFPELIELAGAAAVEEWDALAKVIAWLEQYVDDNPVVDSETDQRSALHVVLESCAVLEHFLQSIRIPFSDIDAAQNTFIREMTAMVPEFESYQSGVAA